MKRSEIKTGVTYGYRRSTSGPLMAATVIDDRSWVAIGPRTTWGRTPDPVEVTLADGSTVMVRARLADDAEKRSGGVLVRWEDGREWEPISIVAPRTLVGAHDEAMAAEAAAKVARDEKSQRDVTRTSARKAQENALNAAHPELRAAMRRVEQVNGDLDFPVVEVSMDALLALLGVDAPPTPS